MSDQTEHELVARLRNSAAFIPTLSLVAVENDRIVGHMLLTKITIGNGQQVTDSLALAPVSVLPAFQNNGIGKLLITQALSNAKELAYDSVHFSESVTIEALKDAALGNDLELKIRPWNTMYANPVELAPIIQRILTDMLLGEEDMMQCVYVDHFNKERVLTKELQLKYKSIID